MKKIFVLVPIVLFLFGCSSSVDTAKLDSAGRYKFAYEYYTDESYEQAIKEFEAFLLQYPGDEYSDDAQFYLGMSHFQRKEYLLAAFEFSKLIKNMPASTYISESQYQLATCYYKLSPPYPLDQRYTRKSIEEYQAFIDFFPADKRVQEAEGNIKELYQKLAEKEFHSAQIYERMENYIAAIKYYSKVMETYHDTKYAPQAQYKKIKLLILKDRIPEALTEMDTFISKYPEDANTAEIKQLHSDLENQTSVSK